MKKHYVKKITNTNVLNPISCLLLLSLVFSGNISAESLDNEQKMAPLQAKSVKKIAKTERMRVARSRAISVPSHVPPIDYQEKITHLSTPKISHKVPN